MNVISEIFSNPNMNLKNIAIRDTSRQISYLQLKKDIASFAEYLLANGVEQKHVIAVSLSQGYEFVLSLLALYYIGATALPLDRESTRSRIDSISSSVKIKYIISDKVLIKNVGIPSITIKMPNISNLSEANFSPLKCQKNFSAHIVYTSGTTGKPKRVDISYGGFLDYCHSLNRVIEIKNNDIFVVTASIGFSSLFRQIFIPLLSGSELLIISDETRKDPGLFVQAIARATVIDLIPSFIELLVLYLGKNNKEQLLCPNIRMVLSASEMLKASTLKSLSSHLPYASFVNMYGLTETSGIVLTYKVFPQTIKKLEDYCVPIGYPLDGVLVSIIDEYTNQPNDVGELCIASPSIGLNILLDNKYYRTGDLAKYNQEGEIVLIGRRDRQIKIAGKRIHLLEIDMIIEEHDLVDKCVTIFEPTTKKLIAFIRPKSRELDKRLLADYVKTKLNHIIIPGEFHFLDKFPLTPSRKLDYKKLIELYTVKNLSDKKGQHSDIYKCEWEREVYKVFSEQLQIYNIKPDDNLFELGVDSLKIAVAMAKITNKLSIDIRLAKVFANPSVRQLASIIKDELALLEIKS